MSVGLGFLDKIIHFEGYSNWTGYEGLSIPIEMTLNDLFIGMGMLMISANRISHVRSEFARTLFGEDPICCIRDFDFNSMLLMFSMTGMIDIVDTETCELTELGNDFLRDRTESAIDLFTKIREESKKCIITYKNGKDVI